MTGPLRTGACSLHASPVPRRKHCWGRHGVGAAQRRHSRAAQWPVTLMTHPIRFSVNPRPLGEPRIPAGGIRGTPSVLSCSVASYLIYADVRTFRRLVIMIGNHSTSNGGGGGGGDDSSFESYATATAAVGGGRERMGGGAEDGAVVRPLSDAVNDIADVASAWSNAVPLQRAPTPTGTTRSNPFFTGPGGGGGKCSKK